MCSLSQLGMNLAHNGRPHCGVVHKTKTPFPRAWGICILESKRTITPNQASLLNLGTTTSQPMFTRAMLGIASGAIQVYYNRVRVVLDPRAKAEELKVLKDAKDQFRHAPWRRSGGSHPGSLRPEGTSSKGSLRWSTCSRILLLLQLPVHQQEFLHQPLPGLGIELPQHVLPFLFMLPH